MQVKTKRRTLRVATVALVLACLGIPGGAAADDTTRPPPYPTRPRVKPLVQPKMICVDHNRRGCLRDVGVALQRAPRGSMIVVQSGSVWTRANSGLTITKPVTVCAGKLGTAKPKCPSSPDDYFSIIHTSRDSCVAIRLKTTERADISGLRISAPEKTLPFACIWVKSGELRLSDSQINGARNNAAILIEGNDTHIMRTRIYDNKDGVVILAPKAQVTLTDSSISAHQHGVILQHGRLTAIGNVIENNNYAGVLVDGGSATLVRNLISFNSGAGIAIHKYSRAKPISAGRLSENFPILLLHNKFVDNGTSVEWNREPVEERRGGILPMQNCFPGSPVQDWPMVRAFENHFLDPEQIAPVSRADCDTLFKRRGDKGLRHACYAYYDACIARWPRHQEMRRDDAESEAGVEHSEAKEAAGDRDAMN